MSEILNGRKGSEKRDAGKQNEEKLLCGVFACEVVFVCKIKSPDRDIQEGVFLPCRDCEIGVTKELILV